MRIQEKEEMFSSIYKEYRHKIYRISFAYIYEKSEVDDLFQEIMVNIWNSLDTFRGDAQIGTWVYRVSVNTALFFNRKLKTYQNTKHIIEDLNLRQDYDDPDEQLVINQKLDRLAKSISLLQKQDRILISLLMEGLSYEAISEIVGISSNYVGVKINRIKKQLKTLLENGNNE